MKFFFFIYVYTDCIFMDRCWVALGLSVKTSREFVLSICGQKTSFVFSGFLTFSSFITKLKKKTAHFPLRCPVSQVTEVRFSKTLISIR